MIVKLKGMASESAKNALVDWCMHREIECKRVNLNAVSYLVTSTSWKGDLKEYAGYADIVEDSIKIDTEYQLSTRKFQKNNTVIDLGNGVVFGTDKTVMMAGPCSVESEKQVMTTAEFLVKNFGIKVFRAGAFKPRTSPYSFQGMEIDGLKLLAKVRKEFGMKIITEVKDETHLDVVAEYADIVQIGTKSMYHFNMLARCGKLKRPIMLKRGFMSTIKEFLQAVDFIMANGNPNVILCERGIRTFEPQTRFCLDVCGASLLKEISHLPMVLDPSHAMGRAAQVPQVAQSAVALEIDGILVETHPQPSLSKSDKEQTLSFDEFGAMMKKLRPICAAVNRTLV